MGRLTISMAIFNSKLLVSQRVVIWINVAKNTIDSSGIIPKKRSRLKMAHRCRRKVIHKEIPTGGYQIPPFKTVFCVC